jgi:hypothetical protein
MSKSPGLLQPWELRLTHLTATRLRGPLTIIGVGILDATLSGFEEKIERIPGLKQPWALRRNRFAVEAKPLCSKTSATAFAA